MSGAHVRSGALALALLVVTACGGGGSAAAPSATATSTTTTTTAPTTDRFRQPVHEVTITRDIEYGSAPGIDGTPEALLLDLYEPEVDDGDATARPAAIFAHGGGFGFGDKREGVSPRLAEHFARLGYVAASINYRLLAVGGCVGSDAGDGGCTHAAMEGVHDAQAAVRFVRAHAEEHRIDPDRIAIGGESAGGVIAYGVGTWSDVPGSSGTPGVSSAVQAFMALSGGGPGGIFATADDAPGIFFASEGDPIVPHAWSVESRDALVAVGVDAELVSYGGDVHVPFFEHEADILDRTIAFWYEHLGLAELR